MPMPKPRKGEKKADFVTRFMGTPAMLEEYPDEEQRAAVAYSQWKELQANNLEFVVMSAAAVKGKVVHKTHEGREYLVAPVIPIVEGVLNGALVTAEEFGKYVQAWEGVPLPIDHPMKRGQYVSANTLDVLESNVVGRLHNVHIDGKKMKAELWIDVQKAETIGDEGVQVMEMLENGEPLEVSTAYYSDDVRETGIYGGKRYLKRHTNLRPDHVALLPNGVGACSWADGAGAPRVASQQEGGEQTLEDNESRLTLLERVRGFLRDTFGLVSNELSHEKTRDALSDALKTESGAKGYIYVREVWDNEFIYEVEPAASGSVVGNPKAALIKRGYTLNDDGSVTLAKDKTEVKEVRTYEPVKAGIKGNEEEAREDVDKKQLIDGLIANEATTFVEEDRTWLEGLEVNQLEKLVPAKPEPKPEKKPKANKEEEPEEESEEAPAPETNKEVKQQTVEEYIDSLPEGEFKEFVTNSLTRQKQHREGLLATLTGNKRCTFSAEELASFKTPQLEKLAESLDVNSDYSGRSVPKANETDEETIPAPPLVVLSKDTKQEVK